MQRATKIGAAALSLVLLWAPVCPGETQGDGPSRGKLLYQIYCMNCHGEAGKGDGPLVEELKIRPADLTRLVRREDEEFPAERVYQAIDGRQEVRGHGKRSMPVWGLTFQEAGRPGDQEDDVRSRILTLIDYLESIQEATE
jgi:hypothetical protein